MSNIGCNIGTVNVYDSMNVVNENNDQFNCQIAALLKTYFFYNSCSICLHQTADRILRLWFIYNSHRYKSLLWFISRNTNFDQRKMRSHFAYCFKIDAMEPFPVVMPPRPLKLPKTKYEMSVHCYCRPSLRFCRGT